MCSAALRQSATTALQTGNDTPSRSWRSLRLCMLDSCIITAFKYSSHATRWQVQIWPACARCLKLGNPYRAMLRMFFGSSTLVHRTYALARLSPTQSLLAISSSPSLHLPPPAGTTALPSTPCLAHSILNSAYALTPALVLAEYSRNTTIKAVACPTPVPCLQQISSHDSAP